MTVTRRWEWVPAWLRRRATPDAGPALVDDGSLPVLGESWDPARADSAAVAEMAGRGVDLQRPLLVRHHLRLPDEEAVAQARRLLASDGYTLVGEAASSAAGHGVVRASRTQVVTGLALAQERTRMAGLAARLGGDVDGWDVCGPSGAETGLGSAPGSQAARPPWAGADDR